MNYSDKFAGTRVMVVEDEFLLAEEARLELEKLGAVVVGPTSRVDVALEYLKTVTIDVAILDIYLAGELVFPVAEMLQDMNIPFVFATAYDAGIVPARFKGFVLCDKPVELERIAKALFGPKIRDN